MDRCARDVLARMPSVKYDLPPMGAFTTEEFWARSGFTRQSIDTTGDRNDLSGGEDCRMKRVEDRRQLSTAERIAVSSRVDVALMLEMNETDLLHFIAQTACELTGAAFAAFTLRSLNKEGQPLEPSEGKRFQLAAVVGITPQQEAFFRHMSSGGEGLLAPLFHQGVPVLVADV